MSKKHIPFKILGVFCLLVLTFLWRGPGFFLSWFPFSPVKDFSIVSWNVENLNITQSSNSNSDALKFSSQNKRDFERMARIASVLQSFKPEPSLIVLQEVLDPLVVSFLNERFLQKRYPYTHYFKVDDSNRGQGFGVLSSWPFEAQYHPTKGFPRGIGQLQLTLKNSEVLVVFINHWKSLVGGLEETEVLRLNSAALLKNLVKESKKDTSVLGVIALGDFNLSYTENILDPLAQQALVYYEDTPLTWFSFLYEDSARELGLPIFRSLSVIQKLDFQIDTGSFLWPFVLWDGLVSTQDKGGYFYRGQFFFLDRVLLDGVFLQDFDGQSKAWRLQKLCILRNKQTVDEEGRPLRSYLYNGVSDHLPVFVHLTKERGALEFTC